MQIAYLNRAIELDLMTTKLTGEGHNAKRVRSARTSADG